MTRRVNENPDNGVMFFITLGENRVFTACYKLTRMSRFSRRRAGNALTRCSVSLFAVRKIRTFVSPPLFLLLCSIVARTLLRARARCRRVVQM